MRNLRKVKNFDFKNYNKLISFISNKYKQKKFRQIYKHAKLHINDEVWKIFTHTTEEERCLLYKLSIKLALNSTIVEVGSYLGASTVFLAAGCKQRKGHLYAIDTWENQAMTEGKKDTFQEFLINTKTFQDHITPIRLLSTDAAKEFLKPIDLIFIDGDHSYEGVLGDLNAWLPKVKSGGWLLLHDWGWAEGVQRVIKEIVEPISICNPITLPNLYAVKIDFKKQFNAI